MSFKFVSKTVSNTGGREGEPQYFPMSNISGMFVRVVDQKHNFLGLTKNYHKFSITFLIFNMFVSKYIYPAIRHFALKLDQMAECTNALFKMKYSRLILYQVQYGKSVFGSVYNVTNASFKFLFPKGGKGIGPEKN
jgi:hypothetical protein